MKLRKTLVLLERLVRLSTAEGMSLNTLMVAYLAGGAGGAAGAPPSGKQRRARR
jgi:hypothetical protein